MAILIVDTPDREQEAFDLLLARGVLVTDAGAECLNVCSLPDDDMEKVKEILDAAGIEWQWQCEDDDEGLSFDEDLGYEED